MAEQVAYRGQARERGFNPIQLSTAGVDAILQQGAGLARQLRENQQIEVTNRNRYQSAMEQAQGLERMNRQSNFEFSEAARRSYQDAVNQNLRTEVANAENAIRNEPPSQISASLDGLAKYSSIILKGIAERKAAADEEEVNAAYMEEYLSPSDPMSDALVTEGIQRVRDSDELIQSTADSMRDTGARPETVESVRKLSKNQELGRSLARADMAVAEWPRYLNQKYESDNETQVAYTDIATGESKTITPMSAQGPDELAAVNGVLLKKFLKEKGILGLNPKFMAKPLKAMREAENAILDREQDLFDKARDSERTAETFAQLDAAFDGSSDTVDALKESMRRLTHLRDDRGPIRPLRAFQMVLEHLVKNGNMEALEALESADPGEFGYLAGKGKTWGEMRKFEFSEARKKINQQRISDEDLSDKARDQEFENWSDEVMDTLYNSQTPIDNAQIDQVIESSKQKFGKIDPRLTQYRQNSTLQARDLEESRANLEALAQNGELTIEELDSGKYPLKLRYDSTLRGIAEQGTRKAEAVNKGLRDQFKGGITAALLNNAKITGTTNTRPASFVFAEVHAMRQMDKLAITYMNAGKTPEEAYQQAARDIVAAIDNDREDLTGKKKFGPYSFNDGEFGLFSSKANPKGQADIASKDVAKTIIRVQQGGVSTISKEKLIPEHILKKTSDLNAPIPEIAYLIANALPKGKSMSPYDILNAQRALYGMGPRQRDVATMELESLGNPKLIELINRVPTASRSSRAVVGANQIGPGQDRQAISYIARKLGINPIDIATIINYETGGSLTSGQYRRGLDRWGGDGGRYLGWIQFSPENQRKFGVRPGMSPTQMADAVIGYFKASGVRSGDGIHVLYQAVQAPAYTNKARSTGKNYSSDSNGAVSTHVARMQKEHKPLAQRWLSEGARIGGGSIWRDPRLMSAPAKRLLSQTPVTSVMGHRKHPISGGTKFHSGYDYGIPEGTKLSLKTSGRVIDIQDHGNQGYGKYVDIELPDGSVARYAHLSKMNVRIGQTIKPKQVFALSGNTGGSTGAHLHLEKYSHPNGKVVDPRSLANLTYADI